MLRVIHAVRDLRTIKQLLMGAEAAARSSGEDIPSAEHLLLSAVSLPDGSARRALKRVGVDPEQLRRAIDQVHDSALATVGLDGSRTFDASPALQSGASGAFRSTPQAQQVFQEAVALSKSMKPSRLLGAHVVAATCSLDRGTAIRALSTLKVDRERLRAAARAELAQG